MCFEFVLATHNPTLLHTPPQINNKQQATSQHVTEAIFPRHRHRPRPETRGLTSSSGGLPGCRFPAPGGPPDLRRRGPNRVAAAPPPRMGQKGPRPPQGVPKPGPPRFAAHCGRMAPSFGAAPSRCTLRYAAFWGPFFSGTAGKARGQGQKMARPPFLAAKWASVKNPIPGCADAGGGHRHYHGSGVPWAGWPGPRFRRHVPLFRPPNLAAPAPQNSPHALTRGGGTPPQGGRGSRMAPPRAFGRLTPVNLGSLGSGFLDQLRV